MNTKIIFLTSFIIIMQLIRLNCFSQNAWTQKADFGGTERGGAIGFSIGLKGYIGTGTNFDGTNSYYYKDFWEYNPVNNTWTQKADFGGAERAFAVGFSIGSKGYIGTGYNTDISFTTADYYKDFWEYDPVNNTWTQKADFGGVMRGGATGFSISSKGYIGTGWNSDSLFTSFYYYKDFWEYDPGTNTWTQKADFGGTIRGHAAGFAIGSKGYMGTGYYYDGGDHEYKDFWEYDPGGNIWTQKTDFGGIQRVWSVGFSIGTKGYMGCGGIAQFVFIDFWEYDPITNTWTQKTNFSGYGGSCAVGFSIGLKGYIGTGFNGGNYVKDFWEYNPTAGINDELSFNNIEIILWQNSYPMLSVTTNVPLKEIIIFDLSGKQIIKIDCGYQKTNEINISSLNEGVYLITVNAENGKSKTEKLFKIKNSY